MIIDIGNLDEHFLKKSVISIAVLIINNMVILKDEHINNYLSTKSSR